MLGSYVLVTPVKDEVQTISRTIESVLSQTILPREWVIVSDGSRDGTDEIVKDAAGRHKWIKIITLPLRSNRSFAAVVENTELGINSLQCKEYQYLGLLDADVSFKPNYFETLIRCFEIDENLGLAGGVVIDVGSSKKRLPKNRQDVPGAVQFFRRSCFESLGGLKPLVEGGWDMITCVMARKNGYRTRLVTEQVVDHLKPRNVAHGGVLQRKWQMGTRDYALGYLPSFEFAKCLGRVVEYPFALGALAWWLGYLCAALRGKQRALPDEIVRYIQQEQRRRLARIVTLPTQLA